ncbi:MAG: helix-turn-helix domain-containing protein [Planctomycetaceae bacterium]|nr:helix-turn-helix domain-containing protein [Planctomycetaceae bacterium]
MGNKISDSKRLHVMIAEGEGLTVEFKEHYTSKIDKDIVAFANTKGGHILLGVADNGRITGQKLNNKIKSEIHNIARNCEPSINISRILQIDETAIVEIPEGDEKPYSCSGGYFRRLDAVTQKMSQREVRILFRQTDTVSFESQVCRNLNLKDISLTKVRTFLKETGTALKVGKTDLSLFFSSLGVLDKNKINNAGALMFASKIEKYIPHSEIILGAFKGNDKTHIFDRKDVRGDLFTQFNEAVSFLMKHLNIRSEIKGVNRNDVYEIPLEVLREAVINAIVHRDYTVKGTSIYVMVFDDRVEIENPGGLLSGVTMQSLGKASVRRNPVIADMFHRMGIVERMGSGIDRMRNVLRNAGLKEPVFEADEFFRVVFFRNPLYSLKKTGGTMEKTVEKTVEKILDLIKNNPNVTQKMMADQTGLTRRGVEWNLRKLKAEGFIRRTGSVRKGFWEIIK